MKWWTKLKGIFCKKDKEPESTSGILLRQPPMIIYRNPENVERLFVKIAIPQEEFNEFQNHEGFSNYVNGLLVEKMAKQLLPYLTFFEDFDIKNMCYISGASIRVVVEEDHYE